MNYKIKDLEELRSGLNTLKETGVGYWDRDEWLKVMIKLTDDLFALHGVSRSTNMDTKQLSDEENVTQAEKQEGFNVVRKSTGIRFDTKNQEWKEV